MKLIESKDIVLSEEEQKYELEHLKQELQYKLLRIRDLYSEQLKGLEIRMNFRKMKRQGSLSFFVASVCITLFLRYWIGLPGASMIGFSWAVIAAYSFMVAFSLKLFLNYLDYHIDYNIQREKKRYVKLKDKYNIFTIIDEEKYCLKKISELDKKTIEIKKIQEIELLKKYRDIEYEEKRADIYAYDKFHERHVSINVICIIIGFIIFTIRFMNII